MKRRRFVIGEKLGSSIYDELPEGLLGGFYCEIQKNIEKGILSEAMYSEIDLIKNAALKRGIGLRELNRKGLTFLQNQAKTKQDDHG